MSAEPPSDESAQQKRDRLFFKGMLVLTLIWLVAFAFLVLLTANPVTINWEQLQRAQTVVLAEVIDKENGTVKLKRFWKNDPQVAEGEEFSILNLPESTVREGMRYLIPLVLFEPGTGDEPDTFEIPLTQTQLIAQEEQRKKGEQAELIPILYPDNPNAISELEKMLKNTPEQPALSN